MDGRDEEDLTIQIPTQDGSQTERTRGTYGGRQRWISGSNGGVDSKGATSTTPSSILASPRRTKSRITAPSVQSYLNSMGIVVGEESYIVDREVNEVATLRREHDTIKNANSKKEIEIKKLEEEIETLTTTLHSRVNDGVQLKSQATNIENKSTLYEAKLEEELADRGVYHHMIQRLTAEALAAKKSTTEREKQLAVYQHEVTSTMASLIAARQEKTASENAYQRLYQQWYEQKQENVRVLGDLQQAVEQTKLKYEILEQREISRKKHVAEALGEMKMKESRRLRHESCAQMTHFSEIQDELSDTDLKLVAVETEFKKVIEAAGTSDVDKIISKFVGREETLRALKEEHAVEDARMRKLREKHKQLNEVLSTLRGSVINSRTVYQEMDQTSERLKEIEKEASALSEKFNRSNVLMDAFRACMLKCLTKLSTVRGSIDDEDHQEQSHAMELPTSELVHLCEQKLNRVLDVINREKAERELHRTEASTAGVGADGVVTSADKSVRAPAPSETEEHFILRMSSANTSPANVRVRPKSRTSQSRAAAMSVVLEDPTRQGSLVRRGMGPPTAGDSTHETEDEMFLAHNGMSINSNGEMVSNTGEDEIVIDRAMRKKLVGLIVNRGKRGKKTVQTTH